MWRACRACKIVNLIKIVYIKRLNYIIQALKGEDITIYGDGSQTRSFCYVDDLIEGIVRMMASREDFLGPVNLGNPGEFTIRELAYKL